MKTMPIFALALAAAFATADDSVADDATTSAEDDKKVVTDFRGHPPFARRHVAAEAAADDARESDAIVGEDRSERVQVVELRGAPPYKRSFVEREEMEQAEFARFEETSTGTDARSTRRGPPGKLTSRR